MSHLKRRVKTILRIVFRFIPLRRDLVYFSSFHGQYSDSPRAISEALSKTYPSIKQVWTIGEKSKEKSIPAYIKCVKPDTYLEWYYQNRAAVVVENYWGLYYGTVFPKSLSEYVNRLKRIPKQFNISTSHCTPIKNIEREGIERFPGKVYYTTSDVLFLSNKLDEAVMTRRTEGTTPFLRAGFPRNDILFSVDDMRKKRILQKLRLPSDKKICLYAPTFRENRSDSGICQLKMLDVNRLCECFKRSFGGEWIFVLRFHDSVILLLEDLIDFSCSDGILYSGNIGDDMAEYLYICDALLTDYSSSFFDYALLKRPCFLFCHDLEHYTKVERGLYLDIRELPFPLAEASDELYDNVLGFNEDEYADKLNKFVSQLGYYDDGNASSLAVSLIAQHTNH